MKMALALVFVAPMFMAASALAQMPGGGARPGTGPAGMGGLGNRSIQQSPDADARMAGANFVELVNMRVAQLEEDLNLQPAQLPLWNAYRERVVQMLNDQRRGNRIVASETSAPKRLDALADTARNRLTAVEDIVDAAKALYAVLTPEQKAVADRRLALPLATLTGNDSGSAASDLRARPSLPPPPKEKK